MNPFKRSNSNKIHVDDTVEESTVSLSDAAIAVYTCPISMEIMIDPVITKEGYTFERSAIMKWLKSNNTCPLSRNILTIGELVPNKNLRENIENCRKKGLLPKLVTSIPTSNNSIRSVLSEVRSPSTFRSDNDRGSLNSGAVWTATGNSSHSTFINSNEMVISFPRREPMNEEQINNQNVIIQMINEIRRLTTGHSIQQNNSLQIAPLGLSMENLQSTYNPDPLELVDIPENPEFSFLTEHEKIMIQSAYHTINRLNKWDYIHRYSPSVRTGYIFDRDPIIEEITNAINEDYNGHSGASMGYTMRRIEYIAKNGFESFKEEYCRSMVQLY